MCGLPRVCPFCLVRAATCLYDRILCGPWRDPIDKFLVLGRLTVLDTELDKHRTDDTPEARVNSVRRELGDYLQRCAADMGMDGGILTFQIAPQLSRTPVWQNGERTWCSEYGFRYHLAVLGEVRNRVDRLLRVVEGDARSIAMRLPPFHMDGDEVEPKWTVRSGREGPLALRKLLAGTSGTYWHDEVPYGALAVQPWNLANLGQFMLHQRITKGDAIVLDLGIVARGTATGDCFAAPILYRRAHAPWSLPPHGEIPRGQQPTASDSEGTTRAVAGGN